MVEMMGIEPMSENPLIGLSSQTVCYLDFPRGSESRHSLLWSSPFVPGRLKSERPTQVHHSFDAQSGVVVLSGGTGGPQATALLSQTLTGVTQAAIATVLLSFNFKVWAVNEITRLAALILPQNPRRNHCTPISYLLAHFIVSQKREVVKKKMLSNFAKLKNWLTFQKECDRMKVQREGCLYEKMFDDSFSSLRPCISVYFLRLV